MTLFKSAANRCFILLQHLLPQHTLSAMMHRLARCRVRWLKNLMIRIVIRQFDVNMAEAEITDPDRFASFNEFFTRTLNPECRPVCAEPGAIVSPADGAVSRNGFIQGQDMLQAKGRQFSVHTLLGADSSLTRIFSDGAFATIYLSPRDYHRLHMPCAGRLSRMIHIPGDLYSVNDITTASVNNLFARNERVVTIFETDHGWMALVLVGAIFVSSIETVWHGEVTPPRSRSIRSWTYEESPPEFDRGAEMGRFNMGSTIIVLFEKDRIKWLDSMVPGHKTRIGEIIARDTG